MNYWLVIWLSLSPTQQNSIILQEYKTLAACTEAMYKNYQQKKICKPAPEQVLNWLKPN